MAPSKSVSTAIFLTIFAATWIAPPWPLEQALHSSLTILSLIALWRTHNRLGNKEFFLIVVFLSIHSIAARWLYSNVPYDDWIQSLTSHSLNAQFGWRRNQFDRLVHLAYGLCLTPALVQIAPTKSRAFQYALAAIMLSSLCYEWLEWLVAITLGEDAAEAYNGQQGDMWDAHKDMLLATLGSLLWWPKYRNTGPQSPPTLDS
jgi:putative membrane protein